jgi:hypothetical protein
MASLGEAMTAGIILLRDIIALFLLAWAGGSVMNWFSNWMATWQFTSENIQSVQWLPSLYYPLILLMAVVRIIWFILTMMNMYDVTYPDSY